MHQIFVKENTEESENTLDGCPSLHATFPLSEQHIKDKANALPHP